MEDELIDYLTLDEKKQMAMRLLKSALVYNHVKSLMLKKSEQSEYATLDAIEKENKRKDFDINRDYAFVIREGSVIPDRLRNYKAIMHHELVQMELLLKTKEVRMHIVKDILEEEGLPLKKYFSKCCNRVVKHVDPSLSRRITRKMKRLFFNSSKMKENE